MNLEENSHFDKWVISRKLFVIIFYSIKLLFFLIKISRNCSNDDEEWKPRTKISKNHLNILKGYFDDNPNPNREEMGKIADEIGKIKL